MMETFKRHLIKKKNGSEAKVSLDCYRFEDKP